jgi:hypothetical protein
MLNTDKLRSAFDLVLSARLVHTDIEKLKEKVHSAADPHVALSTSSKNPTIENCVDLVTEVAMVDAAAALSKEALEEIEGYARGIAKIIARLEIIDSMGGTTAPDELMENLEESFLEATLRYDELTHLRGITEKRFAELVSQL